MFSFNSGTIPFAVIVLALATSQAPAPDAQPDRARNTREFNLADNGLAIQGYSPVSYFTTGKPEKGDPKHAVTCRGVTYWLTSDEQVRLFNADPSRYEPAFGGWCAYGAAIEKKFPIDPSSFKIIDGRLFLFLKNDKVDARELWNKEDEQSWTARAEKWWNQIAGG